MPDQAAGLRHLFARRRPSLLIVAGSDAGKAAVALHFAREAASSRRATVLIDGTAGRLAQACDVACRYELAHVLAGDVALADVLHPLTPHLLLLPAARALARVGAFTADEEGRLGEAFSDGIVQALAAAGADDTQVDLIVVHAEAGQATRAVDAFGRDARIVVVASDDARSLRGAYADMKVLAQQQNIEQFEVVVPRGRTDDGSGVAFTNLANAARRFLDVELMDGGSVPLPEPRAARPVASRRLGADDTDDSATVPSPSHSTVPEEATHAAAVA